MADKLDYKGIFNFYKKQTQVEKKSFFLYRWHRGDPSGIPLYFKI